MNDHQSTRLESVEDIRRWHRQRRNPITAELLHDPQKETHLFSPRRRPPLAMVCLLDDGRKTGEWIRIRSSSLTIGRDRSKSDVAIEFDSAISSRHLEIQVRASKTGGWQWWVRDLNSTNGTFARVASATLEDQQEILIGATRLRFKAVHVSEENGNARDVSATRSQQTKRWEALRPGDLEFHAAQLQCLDQEPSQTFPLKCSEALIGSDALKCDIVLTEDPFISPVHAQMVRDEHGRWQVRNLGAENGTWVRIDEIPVQRRGEFQIGEQRLIVRICQGARRDTT